MAWSGIVLTLSSKERNGRARRAGTTSTSDSVDVILRVIGVVIVYDMSDVPNIFSEKEKKERVSTLSKSIRSGVATVQHRPARTSFPISGTRNLALFQALSVLHCRAGAGLFPYASKCHPWRIRRAPRPRSTSEILGLPSDGGPTSNGDDQRLSPHLLVPLNMTSTEHGYKGGCSKRSWYSRVYTKFTQRTKTPTGFMNQVNTNI
jgi:hypothetical protein